MPLPWPRRPGVRGVTLAGVLLLASSPAPAEEGAAKVPAAASPAAPADPATLEKVRGLLRAGNRAGALEGARAVVAAAPRDVEAHVLYQDAARGQVPVQALVTEYQGRSSREPGGDSAFLLSRLQPPAEAEKTLLAAQKAEPKSYWVQVGLSAALARQGKAPAAEAAALAALELRSGDARAAARAGAQCAEARRYRAAEECYRKAVAAAPGAPWAVLGHAHCLLRLKRLDEAGAALASLSPPGGPGGEKPDPSRLLLSAALAAERKDAAGAEKTLVEVMRLSPGDMDAQVQLSLLRLRRIEGAAKEAGKKVGASEVASDLAALLKCALGLPERGDVRYALGYAREISGDSDGALAEYRQATNLDPLDGDSIAALGAVLLGKGLLDEAAREFTRALDRNPDDGVLLASLAYVFDQQGKSKEAQDAYQRLVKNEPENARAWHGLGLALCAAGKEKEALAPLQKAVDLAPAVPRFQRDLAEALFLGRNWSRAEDILAKVVVMDPKDDLGWDALGRARGQQRKYAEAVAAYEKVAELRDKDPDIRLLLGAYCHEFLKDYEKAISHYNKYLALGGDAADVEDWIAECQAEIDRKKK